MNVGSKKPPPPQHPATFSAIPLNAHSFPVIRKLGPPISNSLLPQNTATAPVSGRGDSRLPPPPLRGAAPLSRGGGVTDDRANADYLSHADEYWMTETVDRMRALQYHLDWTVPTGVDRQFAT